MGETTNPQLLQQRLSEAIASLVEAFERQADCDVVNLTVCKHAGQRHFSMLATQRPRIVRPMIAPHATGGH